MPPNQQPQQPPTEPPKPKGSKISNVEWGLVIGAALMVDLTQLILDLLAIGVILNRFIDLLVGMSLALYFWMRGVKMDSKKSIALIATFLGEEIPAVDALPLWAGDVLVTMLWDKADKNLPNLPI